MLTDDDDISRWDFLSQQGAVPTGAMRWRPDDNREPVEELLAQRRRNDDPLSVM